jgi:8-oxo-dGTP diphosphatase
MSSRKGLSLEGSPQRVSVVACVIDRDATVLLCQRPFRKRHGGLWEFPGGKLLPSESVKEAVQRELGEELGLSLLGLGRRLFTFQDPGSFFVIEFIETRVEGEPIPLEHQRIDWVPRSQLLGYELAPTDREFVLQHLNPEGEWT